jgi:thermostable 8-oxoguanine DNA glycosylase
METTRVLQHLESLDSGDVERYTQYLSTFKPNTDADRFRRWLFAYASVHTSWKMNVKIYDILKDLTWVGDRDELRRRLISVGAGLHNNRSEYISEFADFFWKHPRWFDRSVLENWGNYRDRVMGAAKGIGLAKSSFVMELTYPMDTPLVCVDTHILQLYGLSNNAKNAKHADDKAIRMIEHHWYESCMLWNRHPVAARWIYWDKLQGYKDSRYWSNVLEGTNL